MTATMTKGERQELGSLIRKREKLMRSHAVERSALLMAEFEAATAKIFHWDDDPVWAKAQAEAEAAVKTAQATIEARCRKLGIPAEYAPSLHIFWQGRGHNAVRERRDELRRVAKARVAAMEKEAITKIERLSLTAQTEIVASGLASVAAQSFLKEMPSLDKLMPPIVLDEIETLVETRRAEQNRQRYLQ